MAISRIRSVAAAIESTFSTDPTSAAWSGATRIPAEKIEFKPTQVSHARDARTDSFGLVQAPLPGAKGGTLSFEVQMGGATTNAGGAVTTLAWLDILLRSAGLAVTAGTGTTVSGAGSTTTSVDCTSAAGIAVGSVVGVVISGTTYPRLVTAKSSNTITVSPALPSGPSNGAVVYASAPYMLASDSESATFLLDFDGTEYVCTGCKAKPPALEVKAGQRLMAKFEFQIDSWSATSITGAPSAAALPSVTSLQGLGASAWLGTSATATVATMASLDFGYDLKPREAISGTNGRSDWIGTDAKPTGKITPYYTAQFLTDQGAGTAQPLLVQVGTAAQAMVVFGGEKFVITTPPGPADVGGILGQQIEGVFTEPATATNPVVLALL